MRRLVVLSSLAAVAIAIAAACADLGGLTGGPPDAGGLPDGDVVADGFTPPVDASTDSDAAPSFADAEAGLVDASAVDAAACEDASVCDCDKDEYLRGGSCGIEAGADCDDTVPAINPGAGFITNDAWPSSHTPSFDWNCDGVVTKQLNYNLSCGSLGLNCTGEGFSDDPVCGGFGHYGKCAQFGLNQCVFSPTMMRMQACR